MKTFIIALAAKRKLNMWGETHRSTGRPMYRIKGAEDEGSPAKRGDVHTNTTNTPKTPRTPTQDDLEKEAAATKVLNELAKEARNRETEREIEELRSRSGAGDTYSRPPTQADIEVEDHNKSATDETWISGEFAKNLPIL